MGELGCGEGLVRVQDAVLLQMDAEIFLGDFVPHGGGRSFNGGREGGSGVEGGKSEETTHGSHFSFASEN